MIIGGQVIADDGTPAGSLLLKRGDVFGNTPFDTQNDVATADLSAPLVPVLRAVDDTTLLALDSDRFRHITADHLGNLQARTRPFGNGLLVEVPVMPLLGTPPASR